MSRRATSRSPLVLMLRRFVTDSYSLYSQEYFASSLARAGYSVACPGYRIPPEKSYPFAPQDCADALGFCKSLPGVDPTRCAVIGEGGGGYVAAVLGLCQEFGAKFQGVVAIDAPFDITRPPEQHYAVFRGFIAQYMGVPYEGNEELYELASPVFRVYEGAPPFLLIHGDQDEAIPISQAEGFAAALHEHGVPALLHVVPGDRKEFDRATWSMIERTIRDFLDRLLRDED